MIRIALIGNSHAESVQLPALRYLGGNEVVGLAGRDGEKARASAARWGIPHATADWRTLFDLAPDLVMVTTPVDLHAEMVTAVLDAGCAVLCEKPMAHTVEAAEAMAVRAANHDRFALVDFQLRWNPYRRKLRDLCRDGFVGDVQHIRADLVLDTPNFAGRPFTWWSQRERGGGVLGATGSHMIDGITWMFGPVRAVRARLSTLVPRRIDAAGVECDVTSDDLAEVWLDLESGARAAVTVSLALRGASRWFVEVVGSEGSLRLEREGALTGARHGEPPSPIEVDEPWLPPEHYGITGRGPFAAMNPLFLRDVIGAVASGKRELPDAATFADGLANVRILEAAVRSTTS